MATFSARELYSRAENVGHGSTLRRRQPWSSQVTDVGSCPVPSSVRQMEPAMMN